MAASDSDINLNVGGIYYTTSLLTLNSCPDSMLGKMFGDGGVPPKPDKNGHFFIDRDGKMFRFVLNFMRDKRLCLPSSFEEYDQLLAEADFFQLKDLKEKLQSKLKPQFAPIITEQPSEKPAILLRRDLRAKVAVPAVKGTRFQSSSGTSYVFEEQDVCVLEAKRKTLAELKTLASPPLSTVEIHQVTMDYAVPLCPGMESKMYPNGYCPLVIISIIQDGFKFENKVSINKFEYLIFISTDM